MSRGVRASLVVLVVVAVLLTPVAGVGILAVLMFGHHQGEQASAAVCSVSLGDTTSLEATTASGATITLGATQLENAAAIIAAGNEAGAGQAGQVVALMTALQETRLLNLANPAVPESLSLPNDGEGSNYDSVGVFQQRPSMGWGAVADLMTPATSALIFYERLMSVGGWQDMAPGRAAQTVQRSAYPDAYDRWEPVADTLVSALSSVSCASSTSSGGVPAGLDEKRNAVVTFALQQVGDAYVWGAEGPDRWDCSGLVQGAYRQIGIELEHWSEAQRSAGREVSAAEALPGDIMWWPGHVAIYLGNGELVGAQGYSQGVVRIPVYGSPRYIRVIE
ncbi:Lipoprotein [Actinomyces succiniciruminis]|uniref:Lipoprotein n=1 Tax=Actinomyces succiniciruminis TaxID=1522002 RepID=A0A1L7RNR5_9ACTO|nr:Lipoprotein [Actinomyces succiniciruminis]